MIQVKLKKLPADIALGSKKWKSTGKSKGTMALVLIEMLTVIHPFIQLSLPAHYDSGNRFNSFSVFRQHNSIRTLMALFKL